MKILLASFLILVASNTLAVPEIRDDNLNDIAFTTVLNGEAVILYNQNYCNSLGQLVCRFFRAHEYGHVNLGHLIQGTYPAQAEYEADCWAAQNAPLLEIKAAYHHFMNQGFMGDWSHGTGIQRANRLAQCAQARSGW
jgi:hypothetical protein